MSSNPLPLAGPTPFHPDVPPSEQAGGSAACASALRDELVALLTGRGSSLPAFQGPSPVQVEADAGEPGCRGGAPCAARVL